MAVGGLGKMAGGWGGWRVAGGFGGWMGLLAGGWQGGGGWRGGRLEGVGGWTVWVAGGGGWLEGGVAKWAGWLERVAGGVWVAGGGWLDLVACKKGGEWGVEGRAGGCLGVLGGEGGLGPQYRTGPCSAVPNRTVPKASNTTQYIPQHTAANQYRTVPILNSHELRARLPPRLQQAKPLKSGFRV